MKLKLLILVLLITAQHGYSQSSQVYIGQTTIIFQDSVRNRKLVTEIWYPSATKYAAADSNLQIPFKRELTVRNGQPLQQRMPLIMLSHGSGGGRLTMEWLAEGLVKNGYMVAAVDHWGNTMDNSIAAEFVRPWQRPKDISFVLSGLLNNDQFKQIIDAKRIGMIGFSLEGYTTLALAGAQLDLNTLLNYYKTPAGHEEITLPEMPGIADLIFKDSASLLKSYNDAGELKDYRFKAFFAIAPSMGAGFANNTNAVKITGPITILGFSNDRMTPVKTNAMHYHQLIKHSALIILPGKVGHYVMLGEAIEGLKKELPVYFADDPSVNRGQVRDRVLKEALGFFNHNIQHR